MTITFNNGFFVAHSIFDENEKLKRSGFKWDTVKKKWMSNDFRCAETLISYCDSLAVFQIRFIKENLQKAVQKSASAEGTGNIKLYHQPNMKPYPYQQAGVEYILPRPSVILADSMGLGKTCQALITINMRHPVEALIVCPSILKYNWLKEARKWMIGHITVYIYEGQKIRYYKARMTNHNKDTVLHIINYDILEKFKDRLMNTPFNFFIADESQKIKNPDAQRTKIAIELAKKAKWKIFITGTPIYNKPKDLFVMLNLIDPNMFGDKFQFEQRYCGAYKASGATKYGTATNVDELNTILRANYMVRRLTKDVMKDLPEKVKDVIVINESDLNVIVEKEKKAVEDSRVEEEKLVNEIDKLRELAKTNQDYEADYKERVKKLREIRFKNFGELSRIRKELAIKKIPYVVNFVKEILDNSEDPLSKIVLFGHHTEVLEKLFVELKKYKPVIITGKISDKERQQSISLFSQKNDTRVFIGSMGAAGTGVDGLQNHCHTVVFAELDWTPSLVDQAESRCILKGEQIFTVDGLKNIEDIQKGDLVYTHKGRFMPVIDTWNRIERNKLFVDINYFGYNKPLRVTEDHLIYVYTKEDNCFEWIEAGMIKPNRHFMAFPKYKQTMINKESIKCENIVSRTFKNNYNIKQTNGRLVDIKEDVYLTDDLLYAFGWYVAEGWVNLGPRSGSVSVCGNSDTEIEIIDKVAAIICDSFGIPKSGFYQKKDAKTYSRHIYSRNLAFNFKKWFGDGAKNKKFPEWVFELSNDKIKSILKGYYDGDGYYRKNQQSCTTVSNKLSNQIILLESIIGNCHSLNLTVNKSGSDTFTLTYTENSKIIRHSVKDNFIIRPIKDIKLYKAKRSDERVYDLAVQDDESFIVGLSTVHNCQRIGQKETVWVYHIVADESLDSKIIKMMMEKEAVAKEILDYRPEQMYTLLINDKEQ